VDGREGIVLTFALLTGGLFFLALFALIVAGALVRAWKRLAHQVCALEGARPGEAIRRGWRMMVAFPKDAGTTWVLALAVHLIWAAAFVPLILLLFSAAILVGTLPGLAAGALARLATTGDTPILIGVGVGAAFFIGVLTAPVLLLGGLREVFISSLWTLTYRELRRLPRSEPVTTPSLETQSLGPVVT
jgi:hypothetical protein